MAEAPWRSAPTALAVRRLMIMAASVLPLRAPKARRSPPATGPRLTVVVANVALGERQADAQARLLVEAEADVLCVIEHSAATARALGTNGLAERFAHLADDADEGYFGSLVASRHRIVNRWAGMVGGRRGQVVDLDVDGVATRVVPVHTQAPIHVHDVARWHSTIAANGSLADDSPGPAILAGDWNATAGHRRFRDTLRDHGLVDAQRALGIAWLPTWPVDHAIAGFHPPPFLTLDHVVTTPDVTVESISRMAIPGSDHLGLRAAMRLPAAVAPVDPGPTRSPRVRTPIWMPQNVGRQGGPS